MRTAVDTGTAERHRGWRRLWLPGRVGDWAICLLAAASVALVAASAAVLASPYPGPPAEDRAEAIADFATGLTAHNVPGPILTCDIGCPREDLSDEVVSEDQPPMRIDNVLVYYKPTGSDIPAMLAGARDRLAANGWRVTPLQTDGFERLTATTDDLTVIFFVDQASNTPLTVAVRKRVSGLTAIAVGSALLFGLIGGWMIGAAATNRLARRRGEQRLIVVLTSLPFLGLAPLLIAGTVFLAAHDIADGIDGSDIQAPLVFVAWAPTLLMAAVAGLSGLVSLALAALPKRL